ncbi:MAG: 23S rRNA (pseudouridine(1915)-N(3))-methyltransferase RlmH [Rhodocyclaceae bacterium]|nr:23S rRNA (pseudouridine(1915)-N(3))-methyltransferase RlmH [Rhodocyclaceae bacterium]MCE2981131.1 23S rRNA (pseudouridine(1915)-N(3))-methyltransferase RlmH [Betaproteobacteria bacterium]MCA3075857.1 23S rRNA (pseudouridine(1915)-N(3))-methyltransferase RlmH [Rhodocyclaceae bacterium]MCA3092011.1 23S rRNA (pseudouridine(1915)-N(3))-methyltransferase RlmH [Rhodocyclaceae bacterium]MCA3095865.1 23S rRNA (pseudouridine(1915)-N(3))-methyltransferase RlmH [Rhodocyclaceae bacterium]
MRFRVIAVGERVPAWIDEGIAEYRGRLPRLYRLEVTPVKASPRTQGKPVAAMMEAEASRLEAAVPEGFVRVALDEHGRSLDTRAFAAAIERWRSEVPGIAFWIGGPDGLAPALAARASMTLALSALTLPHALARLVLVEQIYRCVSLLEHHPYHRE